MLYVGILTRNKQRGEGPGFTNQPQGDRELTEWCDCEKDKCESHHGISSKDRKTSVFQFEALLRRLSKMLQKAASLKRKAFKLKESCRKDVPMAREQLASRKTEKV